MSNKNCTYTFTNGQGQKQTIMGLSSMKAFLVDGGLDLFYPDGKYPWLKTDSAVGSVLADQRGLSGDVATPAERDLRGKAHDDERAGDIMLSNGRFVSLSDAVAAARANMTPAQWAMPFQFNNVLDIAPRDWDRMVKAMEGVNASSPPPKIDTSADDVDLDAMFDDVLAEEMAKDEAAKPVAQPFNFEMISSTAERLLSGLKNQGSMKSSELRRLAGELASAASDAPADSISLRQNGKALAAISYQAGSAALSYPNAMEEGQIKNLTTLVTRILASARSAQQEMAIEQAAKPAPQSKPKASKPRSTAAKPPRTAGQAAASAAKNTASALANAIDGLGALFGGGGKFNSGLSFDEDTYAKAKPLFQAAIANLGDASADLKEAMRAVVRMVMDKFGAQAAKNMKPYAVRFVRDVQNGTINGENNDESQVRLDGPQALEGMAPEQGRGAQGAGGVGGRNPGGSQGGNAAGGGADADGVSAARGGRGGTTRVRTSGAGAGGRKRRGSDRAGEAGSGIPGDDARGNADSAGSGTTGLIEPPAIPAVNYRITAETRLGVGSEVEKFNDNIEAIKTLKRIEAERRRATPDEQRILARYVGWGGLASAFPNPATGQFKDKWQERGELLRSLLTKQEYDKASNSTIAAHFTSETVVRSMWDIAKRLGFKGGLALEDSMGVGNFVGLMPEGLDARFIGVELDSLTSRIAQALYPQATVLNSGFEQVPIADNAFALNIGNPPFSNVSLNFQFKPDLAGVSMHNQFFRAGMDALRPGGLQIKVVSRYLMDAQDKSTRLALASKARLLGVIRLPDTAFKENARTEVVTDIVILQKLSPAEQAEMDLAIDAYKSRGDKYGRKTEEQQRLEAKVPAWVETTLVPDPLGGEPMRINSYLARNPQNIMGTLERSGSMQFKNDVTVRLDNPQRLGDMLAEAVARLPERVHSLDAEVAAATEERFKSLSDALRIALANEEIGHLKIDEDGVLQRVIERETPEGGYELSRQAITPSSPWSPQLSQDAQGRWYRLVAKVDADGNTVKEIGKDGKLSKRNVYEREVFQSEQDVPDGLRLGETAYARLRSIVGLRNLLKAQLVMETEDVSSEEMEANRAKLAEAYQVFVAEHGPVNRPVNLNLAMTMPDGGLVTALEVSYQPARTEAQAKKSGLPAQDEMATPAPIMRERVVPKYEPATTAGTAADALAIVLSETGRVDIERIAALRDLSQDDVVAELQAGDTPLVFKNPETNQYETADVYLSGMVKRKIKAAQAAGLEINVRALEAVQPEPWTAENVTVSLGANWVPVDVYADFVNYLTGGMARVSYSPLTNAFSLTNRGKDRAKHEAWSSEGAPVEYLIQRGLNSQSANVTYKDSDGNTRIDRAATDLANLKLKEIKAAFADWVFADAARRERLVAINNEIFNTRVTRQHNGQHLKLPGKVPDAIIRMRRHQLNAIWRGIYERFMLIDHAVGAGKTFTGIARAMERRRMGLSKKPMIVVPNHLVEQWAADVYRLYPGAKVLAAGKKDFEVKNRRRLLGKIATGDWDIVIMPHSSFGGIGIAPETERRYLEEELQLAIQAVQDAEDQAKEDGLDNGWRKPFGVKMAEALVTKIRGRMERLNAGVRDRLLTFEQLGVDDLTVDEAHEFKNLYYSSKLTKVRGMGDQGGSRKANDLYNKVRVLRDSPTGSVTFMTGTPISNSAVEMFTMMRYLAADSLKEMGLENFDAWRTQFVEHTTAFEPTETGSLKEVARLGRTWSNMRGLMELYYQFTDAVSLEDIQRWYSEDNGGKPFPVPKLKGGDRQLVKIKPTQAQEAFLKEIIAGFDGLPDIEDPDERNAERLRLMDRARKVSLDVRAIDPTNPSKEEGGKLDAASQNIKRIYDQYNGVRGTQLVFLDRSVPKSKGDDKILKEYDELLTKRDEALASDDDDAFSKVAEALEKFDSNEMESLRAAQTGGWNAYQQLKDNLVAMGIPANEIRFIQDANTDEQKLALFDSVNGGKVRVLIGSTPRMGAGTNVQKRAVALHHIDVTWKPSDIEQREGRVIRQGNLFSTPPTAKEPNPFYRPDFEVEIIAYATERTVDAKMWDLNATKLKTINGIRKYDGSFTMDFEDSDSVSMAEMAALASGNPLLLERVKLESEISNLELQERAHRRKMYGALDALRTAEEAIRNNPERIVREEARVKDAAQRVQALQERAEARRVTIEGQEYRDRFAAAKAIREAIEQQQNGDEKAKFSVSINGKRYSGKESTIDAMDAALGDVQPFEMTIGDKVLIQRTAAGREVAAVLGQATVDMTGELTTEMNIGEVMGLKLVAGIRRFSTSDGMMLDVDLSAVNAIGQTIASEQLPTNPSGTVFNTTTVKNSLDRLFASMVADSSDHKLNRLISQLQYAKEHIEEYRQKADQPFPGAEDIKAKRDRLKEVVSLLDGSAAPVVDVAPALVVERWNPGQPRYMQPAFSRAAGSRAGMAQQQAQSVVNAIRARWANAPEVVVAADMNDTAVPQEVRDYDAKQRSLGAKGELEGFWHDGKVYIVAGTLRTPGDVARVLFHESLGHYGLRGVFGDGLKPLLLDLANKRRAELVAKAREYGLVPKSLPKNASVAQTYSAMSEQQRAEAAEELLAVLAQTKPELGFVQRAIAAIRSWVRKNIPMFADLEMTDAEIIRDYIIPARRYVERGGPNGGLGGDFDPANPDIRFSRAMPAPSPQPGAWAEPGMTSFDNFVYKLQDKLIDTKRVQAAITKTAGEIEDELNAYQREELYHGRAAKRAQDFLTQELNPMVEQLAKDKIELADFEEYLHARHAPEANRVLAERNPNQAMINAGRASAAQAITALERRIQATTDNIELAILRRAMANAMADLQKWNSVQPFRGTEEDRLRLSGMSDDQARAIMDALTPEQRAKLDAAAAQFDAIVAQNRQLMVDYDLEDQETIDSWSQLFQHYVPLMREDEGDGVQQGMGTGQGFSIKGREVKSRTGSTRKVVDIVANVAMQRERIITRGEKNRVSQALMGLAALNPNPDFWKLGAPDKKRQYDPATNTVKVVTDPLYKSRENVVVAKVRNSKGRVTEVALTFNEKDARAVRMAVALKNLEDNQLGTVMSWTAKITRYMASVNTQYNPIFGVVNLVRDLQGAAVNLDGTPLAGSKARVVKNAVLALADIYLGARQERKGTERQTQWGRLWKEFQEVGGMTGFRDQFRNSGDRARAIERTMNPEKWMESAFGKVVTAGGLLKKPMTWVQDGGGWVLDLLSDYNLAMESGVRLATYKEGLDKGLTQEQAASLAKNITVNFNRRGSIGLHMGSAYAFFNAAMQGTARLGQALTTMEDGKLKTLRLSDLGKKVVAGGLTMGVAQAVALAMAGFGDDEPPQFVREKNLIIPTGWSGIGSEKGYLTIPMPLGLHVIPGLGRHLTEFAMSGGKNPAERVTMILGMFLDAFNPIGNAGWSLQTIAPTVLDPLAALAENKDFTGRNIAMERRNPNVPGHTLARDTASTFSKLLSEAINTLTGGNEYVSGVMSPTPDQIDYLVGQVTGGVGRELMKVEQTVRGAITGEEVPLYKIPLAGRFVGDSNGSGGQGTIFRANLNRLDRAQMEIHGLRKDGRFQESEALRQRSNPYLLAQARAAESQVQRLRRMKHDLVKKGADRDSVREVERKISEAMTRLNRAVEAQQQ